MDLFHPRSLVQQLTNLLLWISFTHGLWCSNGRICFCGSLSPTVFGAAMDESASVDLLHPRSLVQQWTNLLLWISFTHGLWCSNGRICFCGSLSPTVFGAAMDESASVDLLHPRSLVQQLTNLLTVLSGPLKIAFHRGRHTHHGGHTVHSVRLDQYQCGDLAF